MIIAFAKIAPLVVTLAHASGYEANPTGEAKDLSENMIGKLARHFTDKAVGYEIRALSVLGARSALDAKDSENDMFDDLLDQFTSTELPAHKEAAFQLVDQSDLVNMTVGFPAPLSPRLTRVGRKVNALARKAPRIAAACSAFAIDALGDITAQRLEIREAIVAGATGEFNVRRALAMGCFSGCFSAGVMMPFYQILERIFNNGNKREILYKTAISNVAAVPLVVLPAYFACTSYLTGENVSTAVQRFRDNYVETLKGSTALSIPVDLLLFSVVPVHLRATVDNVFDYAWSLVISVLGNRQSAPEAIKAVAMPAKSTSLTSIVVAAIIGLAAGIGVVLVAPRLSLRLHAESEKPLLTANV